jgi:hypothetical protein
MLAGKSRNVCGYARREEEQEKDKEEEDKEDEKES